MAYKENTLTPDIVAALYRAARDEPGLTIRDLADEAGVPKSTLSNWLNRGLRPDSPYAALRNALLEAGWRGGGRMSSQMVSDVIAAGLAKGRLTCECGLLTERPGHPCERCQALDASAPDVRPQALKGRRCTAAAEHSGGKQCAKTARDGSMFCGHHAYLEGGRN